MNRSYSKIRHIQESNIKLEKRILNEGFIPEYTKEEAIASFKEAQNGQGTVSLGQDGKMIVFNVGPRRFYISELQG